MRPVWGRLFRSALVNVIVTLTFVFILAAALVWSGIDRKGQTPDSAPSEQQKLP